MVPFVSLESTAGVDLFPIVSVGVDHSSLAEVDRSPIVLPESTARDGVSSSSFVRVDLSSLVGVDFFPTVSVEVDSSPLVGVSLPPSGSCNSAV